MLCYHVKSHWRRGRRQIFPYKRFGPSTLWIITPRERVQFQQTSVHRVAYFTVTSIYVYFRVLFQQSSVHRNIVQSAVQGFNPTDFSSQRIVLYSEVHISGFNSNKFQFIEKRIFYSESDIYNQDLIPTDFNSNSLQRSAYTLHTE